MKVGLYVDGFNLYYGGRSLCGRGASGWRWLDIRSLTIALIGRRRAWSGAVLDRVVYCTARVDGAADPLSHQSQDIYLKALIGSGSVDHVEYGHFVSRVRSSPLATSDQAGHPRLTTARWPVVIRDSAGSPVKDAQFLVSYAHREEKGSDVNIAAHLLLDTLEGRIDAAVLVSNDSDLRLPVEEARKRVPVGVVNPSANYLAGDLRGDATDGVGRHWWMASAGFYSSPGWNTKHPRLQILTVADLLGGTGIDYPSRHGNVTFRKAPRLQRDADHEQMEFGGASAPPDDFGDE